MNKQIVFQIIKYYWPVKDKKKTIDMCSKVGEFHRPSSEQKKDYTKSTYTHYVSPLTWSIDKTNT